MTYCDFVDFKLIALSHGLDAIWIPKPKRGVDGLWSIIVVSETFFSFVAKIAFSAILQPILTKLSALACVRQGEKSPSEAFPIRKYSM
jgi:hypothetical protein